MNEENRPLTDLRLRTPRAAAVAGILFAVLLITAYVLIRVSIPPDPADGAVKFVAWIPEHVRGRALDMVADLSPKDAQIVIDEWAGRVGCDIVDVPPLVELQAMVEEYMEGCCGLAIAETTRHIRAQSVPKGGYILPEYDWETGCD